MATQAGHINRGRPWAECASGWRMGKENAKRGSRWLVCKTSWALRPWYLYIYIPVPSKLTTDFVDEGERPAEWFMFGELLEWNSCFLLSPLKLLEWDVWEGYAWSLGLEFGALCSHRWLLDTWVTAGCGPWLGSRQSWLETQPWDTWLFSFRLNFYLKKNVFI